MAGPLPLDGKYFAHELHESAQILLDGGLLRKRNSHKVTKAQRKMRFLLAEKI